MVSRPLAAAEYTNFVSATGTTNNTQLSPLRTVGGFVVSGSTNTVNSLTLASGNGIGEFSVPISSVLTVTSGGIIAQPGNTGLSGGQVASGANPLFIWGFGDSGVPTPPSPAAAV